MWIPWQWNVSRSRNVPRSRLLSRFRESCDDAGARLPYWEPQKFSSSAVVAVQRRERARRAVEQQSIKLYEHACLVQLHGTVALKAASRRAINKLWESRDLLRVSTCPALFRVPCLALIQDGTSHSGFPGRQDTGSRCQMKVQQPHTGSLCTRDSQRLAAVLTQKTPLSGGSRLQVCKIKLVFHGAGVY